MHAVIGNSPMLMVAAAAVAFLISTVIVVVVQVVFRVIRLVLQLALLGTVLRLFVVAVPVLALLVFLAHLHH